MQPPSLPLPMPSDWLVPQWNAPGTAAWMTTRHGGVSAPPYHGLNLGTAVGDDAAAVEENRRRLVQAAGDAHFVYLKQVHGARVVRLSARDAQAGAVPLEADASLTTEPGIACTVLVADCLPVLVAAPHARGVAAAHAGWRGLAAGVLQATVAALCEAARCRPQDLQAWLGACIGPRRFEVGPDVLEGLGADPSRADALRFQPCGPSKWLAHLPLLARDRLQAAGLRAECIHGGTWCTVEDASRFFSYRRDRTTGRMAAAVWIVR